jgi:hypothetical protein
MALPQPNDAEFGAKFRAHGGAQDVALSRPGTAKAMCRSPVTDTLQNWRVLKKWVRLHYVHIVTSKKFAHTDESDKPDLHSHTPG